MFKKMWNESESTLLASYSVARNIVKKNRPFVEGEFSRFEHMISSELDLYTYIYNVHIHYVN